jgi:hypothetical protein
MRPLWIPSPLVKTLYFMLQDFQFPFKLDSFKKLDFFFQSGPNWPLPSTSVIRHIQFPLLFLNLLFLYSARFNCFDFSAVLLIIRSPSKHVIETLPTDSSVVHVSHSVYDLFNYNRNNWQKRTKPKQRRMVGVAYLKYTSTLKNHSNSRPSKRAGSFPRTGALPVSVRSTISGYKFNYKGHN